MCWILGLLLVYGCSGAGGRAAGAEDRVYAHKVTPGETLEDIAEEYYGNPSRAGKIRAFNDLGEERVQPGTIISIPISGDDFERLKTRESAREPYNQGLAYAEKGSYLDAVHSFQEALGIDAGFVDAHYNLGVTFQKMKSYDKALDRFNQAIRLRPNVAEYHFALGNSYFHLQQYGEAAAAFENVMKRDESHAKAQYALAVSYQKLGQNRKAREAWQRFLEIDSSSVWANEARRRLKELE